MRCSRSPLADMAQPPALVSLPIITPELPAAEAAGPRLPRWLKRNVPKGNANHFTASLLEELRLETVCDNAKCPNRMECYSQKTATFMILGNVCTRPCGFCSVAKGKTLEPSKLDEPERLAEASLRLGLKHVVITSVTRDDLADGGAEHFYRCVLAVREKHRRGGRGADARFSRQARRDRARGGQPARSLQPQYRDRAAAVSRGARPQERLPLDARTAAPRQTARPAIRTKSGLMLGLGETRDELFDTLADLLDAGCDMLTLGQYLQPSPEHLPVVRYVPPEEFDELGRRPAGWASRKWPAARSSARAITPAKWPSRPRAINRGAASALSTGFAMRHNLVVPDLGLANRPITLSLWLVERGRRTSPKGIAWSSWPPTA